MSNIIIPRVVLWDCDGVLGYNNEAIAMPVAGHVLNDAVRGLTQDEAILAVALYDIEKFTVEKAGGHFNQFYEEVAGKLKPYGLTLPALADLDVIKIQRTIDELSEHSRPAPNLSPALAKLTTAGFEHGVATSSEFNRVLPSLAKIEGFDFGKHVYSAADTMMELYGEKRPKPLPDVYIHAAAQFGLHTEEERRLGAVAVEDSKSGMKAAIAAKIEKYAFGYVGGPHIPNKKEHARMLMDQGAAEVFDDMLDLASHVISIRKNLLAAQAAAEASPKTKLVP